MPGSAPLDGKRTVLLVDDDWMNRELMQIFLERAGYRVVHANNGAKALELSREQAPDVVVCDYFMNGMSGIDVCRIMKAEPGLAQVPFIMLTAYHNDAEREHALSIGVDAFLLKMGGASELLAQIKQLIG
jgi:CheY-like chemotaxis protein